MPASFDHITTWVFDLDNTLYPPQIRLFDQIEARMRRYVSRFLDISLAQADELRAQYWKSHGTTLAGMMEHHAMPPDAFMDDVHNIDFSVLPPDPELAALISALPGRKLVYTNGSRPYAQNVLAARGLHTCLTEVYGIEHADFIPKPQPDAFAKVFTDAGISAEAAVMFEDEERNLQAPKSMGAMTVLVSPNAPTADYVDLHGTDLIALLQQIAATLSPPGGDRAMSGT